MSAPTYRKSSYSNMQCVEVAPLADGSVAVRNTRARSGPALEFTRDGWAAFIAGAQAGEFDFGLDIAGLRDSRSAVHTRVGQHLHDLLPDLAER